MTVEPGSVLLTYVHPGTVVEHSFLASLTNLLAWDFTHDARVLRAGGPLAVRCSTGGLPAARNEAMRHFLDQSTAEWLWIVDTDMGFHPDTLDRLVDAADAAQRPVVGGLCFGQRLGDPDGLGGYLWAPFPTLYDWKQDEKGHFGFGNRLEYAPNTVTQVAGTGAACLLVHRDAAAKVRAEAGGDVWFEPVRYGDGRPVSEDLSFCYRLGVSGVPLFVHTGVVTSHAKTTWVSQEDFLALMAARGRDV